MAFKYEGDKMRHTINIGSLLSLAHCSFMDFGVSSKNNAPGACFVSICKPSVQTRKPCYTRFTELSSYHFCSAQKLNGCYHGSVTTTHKTGFPQ
eukprot:167485-Pyramimonas_sp.AAC.1